MRCCFIGHSDSVGIEEKINEEVKKLLNAGINEFYSGGMGNFDKICEKVVKELGGRIVFVPYNISRINESDKFWYDEIICPFGNKKYYNSDIPKRNQWLVDNCEFCLCNVYKEGGAKRTYDYAIKKKKFIINISEK